MTRDTDCRNDGMDVGGLEHRNETLDVAVIDNMDWEIEVACCGLVSYQ